MEPLAIKVASVHKNFLLHHQTHQTLKGKLVNVFLRNGKARRETQHALKGVSFEVKRGEFFGIVGRNGSGKSTLLKILAGIYQPTKGSVTVHGKLVPFIELGVGFNPELTGRENVYLNGALLGFSRREMMAMYDEIVAFAELERFMDQKLKNYSSGMQVRLAFSLAIRAKADILLIDEVLAVGDADFRRKCFRYFRELKKSDTTVILVTHDMDAVREYCDRAILINKSRVVAEGSANEIATRYIRMFNEEELSEDDAVQRSERWGNGNVVIDSVKLSQRKAYDENTPIRFTITATAKRDIEEPVFGFLMRNESGVALSGTNSRLKQKKIVSMKAGETVTVDWSIDNVFPSGTYFIDPSIIENDLLTACDWWGSALTVEVRRLEHNPYPVQPSIGLEVR